MRHASEALDPYWAGARRDSNRLHPTLTSLPDRYDLDIVAPFTLDVDGERHQFTCLIRGYGAANGMVADPDWNNFEPVERHLVERGYGYSCFDMTETLDTDSFHEVLTDWGKVG